ncbi:MAG: hypothetical protein ACJ8AT_26335 [Hyalangium sp.]|uniref:hypothetical protein n=1 Tax=Hyalangium sp. TaxID=2028555 RepID=UPI00389A3A11
MVSNSSHRRLAALLCALGLLVLPGCDKGPEQLAKAEAQYSELVQRGVPPRDPAWDAVIAAYDAIPKDSKARPKADIRIAALRALRGKLPPRPLATPGGLVGPDVEAVVQQRAECEKLARLMGMEKEERRDQVRQQLDACREKLVRLEATAHPPGEGGEEHETVGGPELGRERQR